MHHTSPGVRTRSWDSESPAAGYRRLKKIVPSAVNRDNSKNRYRRKYEEGAR